MKNDGGAVTNTESPLIFASYNVHAWIGTDGVTNMGRVLRVVRNIGADVVGLQEASLPLNESLSVHRDIIKTETGMHVAFGPTMLRRHADFGNILLSRHPFEEVRRFDISVRSREPRGIVEGLLRIRGRSVRVCTTHFGLRAVERIAQARRLASRLFRPPAPSLLVAMGDLNEWIPKSPFIRPLLSRFPPMGRPRSFPSTFPLLALDRVLVHGADNERMTVTAHRNRETRLASDHLPVVVRIDP